MNRPVYIWCGERICQKREDDGETVVRSYYGQGFVEDETAYSQTSDHLGSVWQVVDDDGESVTSLTTYTPWGEQSISGAGPHSSFGYTGHLRHSEPTDVALAQYRGYDPRLGRWLNRDPLGSAAGVNLHSYVLNGPMLLVDPDGRIPVPFAAALVALAFGLKDDGSASVDGTAAAASEAVKWWSLKQRDGYEGGDKTQPPGPRRPKVPGDSGPPGKPGRLDYYHCMLNCECKKLGSEHAQAAQQLCNAKEDYDRWKGKTDSEEDEQADRQSKLGPVHIPRALTPAHGPFLLRNPHGPPQQLTAGLGFPLVVGALQADPCLGRPEPRSRGPA